MQLALILVFFGLILGVLAYSLVVHYGSSRRIKGTALITALVFSLPILVFSLFIILSQRYAMGYDKWALGSCAVIAAFWLKNPLSDLRQG
jgi:hypothetical protein